MKRIAFFQTDLLVGGIQKSLINILGDIDYTDTEVDVYLYHENCFFDMPENDNLHIYYLKPLFRSLDRVMYFGLVKALAGDQTGGKIYDVAVDFNSYQNDCAVGVVNCRAKKRVMWIHNDMEIKLKEEPKYRLLWHFFKGKFRHFDAFAAVSPGIIEGFQRVTGITDKPVVSIPNHIDTSEIFRKKDAEAKDLALNPARLNLCSVGRLCHQKGYDLLLDCLAEVKKQRGDLALYLIGDGPDRAALEAQARSLGLDKDVTFLGNRENPFTYMDKMDGFVLTSRYEGQGMVIREAQALGLPLYLSSNLAAYNPGIPCCDDMTAALVAAKKPERKEYDDLAAYNEEIADSLRRLLEW